MSLPLASAAELKLIYPEFAGVSNDVVSYFIADADEEINEDLWGTRAKKAEMLLACHMMIVAGVVSAASGSGAGGSAGGPVQSVSVGDVSVTYAGTAASAVSSAGLDASFAASRYGVEYARLVKTKAFGADVI